MLWVALTLLGSFMMTIRVAGQKMLAANISPWSVVYVRFIFGFPVALLVFLYLYQGGHYNGLQIKPTFFLYILAASLLQLFASFCSVLLLGRKNFAVGSTLVKSEVVFTAIFGWILFAVYFDWVSWLAIVLNLVGLVIIAMSKMGITLTSLFTNLDSKSAVLGLLAGVGFALCSLFIRQASLHLELSSTGIEKGILVLLATLTTQLFVLVFFIVAWQRYCLNEIVRNLKPSLFIGVTSALGSLGWYSAYTLQTVAYVKVLGQIDMLFTILITLYFFREKIQYHEYVGLLLIVSSIVLLFI